MSGHALSTAIWGDGGGSTFRATIDAVHDGEVKFEVPLVLTTDFKAGILDHVTYARNTYGMDIEAVVLAKSVVNRRQTQEAQDELMKVLSERNIGNLILMGSLVIIGQDVIAEFNGDIPEVPLPKTLEEAQRLMVPDSEGFGYWLPKDFPDISRTGQYGIMNTHPAPTIVTANTIGLRASERMIRLRSRESAVTFHAVAPGVDTGPIATAHKFPIELPVGDISETTIDEYAKKAFIDAQRIEKAHLPLDVAEHLRNRQEYQKNS